ncbi:S-adenosyl-L-methionine-dependent tRNA 4-demethylwyosine synthase [Empidonax traillii]|uniref:S-adenosyl-L-methionine-dependent tRNA 4-demethylwyosine synthase n=1 Tax=Empidonax traillii TaxID=164674 RepID=UPI000FFD82D7|nr:S-adenosyl-L-methionine-dependent tRNA 4-demethylwyosine synthase [Empidonax traillii]
MDMWSYFHTCLASIWLHRFYIYSAVALGISLWIVIQFTTTKTKKKGEKSSGNPTSSRGTEDKLVNGCATPQAKEVYVTGVKIFYGSQTGTAKRFAKALAEAVTSLNLPVEVVNMGDCDPDDCLAEEATSRNVCVFLVATYTDGQPPESAAWFCKWLEEAASDFRVGKTYLKGLRYAVFGLGNSVYVDHYNTVGRRVDRWLWVLGASRVMTRTEGDCNVARSRHGSIEGDFEAWKAKFLTRLQALCRGERKPCSGKCKKGKCRSPGKQSKESSDHEHGVSEHENTEAEELFETSSEEEADAEEAGGTNAVVDVEDLGNIMGHMKKAKGEHELQEGDVGRRENPGRKEEEEEKREMITPALRDALTKQGYKLIGSHSGVKLCRWTKVGPLSFSPLVDKTKLETYSVSEKAVKCLKKNLSNSDVATEESRGAVFIKEPEFNAVLECLVSSPCRHHTNPVGTEWRWKMDQPELILQEAIENHQNMIKQFRGVSGVKADRFEEALTVKHCALSLVGEPIMYPQINRFVRLLHQHSISSFLVTNAQFPEEIRSLEPVTQLYVSVDASTRESLRRIDRPLFKDFWQRFLDSLKALAEKVRS